MPTDKLTEFKIRKTKPAGKRRRLADGGGLYLEIQPSGARYWRLKYRIAGREKRISLGVYPTIGLAEARIRRDRARKLLAHGADPSEERKRAKAADLAEAQRKELASAGKPLPGTFEFVAREWLTTVHQVKVSPGHAQRTQIRFEQDVFPWLGRREIDEIEAPDLLQCLRRIEARGAIETAHRAKDSCGQVFRYGIASGVCRRNPAADLRDALRPTQTKHHAAIIDPARAAELLRAMMAYKGHPITRAALQLSALLFLRPGELRKLEWEWISLEDCTLTIPSMNMKRRKEEKVNGPPHLVPLAPQAISALKEIHPLTGRGRYVFRSLLTAERPMSENTVRNALRRMGYTNDDMTAQGFRAMARTLAHERLGLDPLVIEAQLAHAVPDALGRAYNRTQLLEQRRDLMVKWADYLDQLRGDTGATAARAEPGRKNAKRKSQNKRTAAIR